MEQLVTPLPRDSAARRRLRHLGAPRIAALLVALLMVMGVGGAAAEVATPSPYTLRAPTRDGIGKVYMGREIARVMGHRGAGWLERGSRAAEERPDLVVEHMGLEPDDVVADIGAGTGYFSFRISPRVPAGKVLAVDIQPEMLEIIAWRMQELGSGNVTPVVGTVTDPKLPTNGVDAVLLVDAYHEFSHPREMMEGVFEARRPGGRVTLVEYRGEDPNIPIKPLHKMTEAQAREEMETVGLRWRATHGFLPQQHYLVFEKP